MGLLDISGEGSSWLEGTSAVQLSLLQATCLVLLHVSALAAATLLRQEKKPWLGGEALESKRQLALHETVTSGNLSYSDFLMRP